MPRTKLPLSEVFDQIGMETCVLLLKESAHLEPLARRFCQEFPRLPKRKRDAIGAAQIVSDYGLDINLFRNLLVKLYSRHQQSLARIKQAAQIGELTDVSMSASIIPANFEERKPHLVKHGVIDSDKGVNIDMSQTYQQQNNYGMPSFEQSVIDIEDKMRALNPASQEFVDGELVNERESERVPA